MVIKILFGKQSGVGKDLAADYMIAKYGGIKMKFAEPIYDIQNYIQSLLSLPKLKDRKLLQFIGHDWGREQINNDLWVNYAMAKIEENIYNNIFISDNRYENEIVKLKKYGFIAIKIIRSVETMDHSSEQQYIDDSLYDEIIENNDTIENFHKILDQIYIKYNNNINI